MVCPLSVNAWIHWLNLSIEKPHAGFNGEQGEPG
jgi:hypothetical protein